MMAECIEEILVMLNARKFNKRAGKITPVVRIVTSSAGREFALIVGLTGEPLVKLPSFAVGYETQFQLLKEIRYFALRDWLASKIY